MLLHRPRFFVPNAGFDGSTVSCRQGESINPRIVKAAVEKYIAVQAPRGMPFSNHTSASKD